MNGDVSLNPDKDERSGDIDPRVQVELETLNFASTEINKLEREIDMARNKFHSLLSNCSSRLNHLYKKLGKCVGKARPYYELQKQFKQTEGELTKATLKFQRANSLYQTAKETVALAEERMINCNKEEEKPEFDSAWQEMMNHATLRFTESEKEKRLCEEQHQICAAEFAAIQQKLRHIEKDIPRSINRAKPYFELKDQLEGRLQAERQSVEDLQRALTAAKETYSETLKNLELISEEIHAKRKLTALPPRTPGVGAEAGSPQADVLTISLDTESISSEIFPDESDVASLSSQDAILMLDSSPTDPLRNVFSPVTEAVSPTAVSPPPSDSAIVREPRSKSPNIHVFSRDASPIKPIPVQSDPLRCIVDNKASLLVTKQSSTASDKLQNYLPAKLTSELTHSKPKGSDNKHSTLESSVSNENTQSKFHDIPNNTQSTDESEMLSSPLKLSQNTDVVDNSSLKSASKNETSRSRPRDKRVQKLNPSHFPILQGLSETNKRMSPKLPHGRPKGQDIVVRHSPSPVRKANTEYFIYPEPKLRSRGNIAREVSPGPNLFPDSDTSLFEKNNTPDNSEHKSVNLKSNKSISSTKSTKVQESQQKNKFSHFEENEPQHKTRYQNENMDKLAQSSSTNIPNDCIKNPKELKHNQDKLEVDGMEEINTNQSNNTRVEDLQNGDGMTDDGKIFYHV